MQDPGVFQGTLHERQRQGWLGSYPAASHGVRRRVRNMRIPHVEGDATHHGTRPVLSWGAVVRLDPRTQRSAM